MSRFAAPNDLDRAIMAVIRSQAAMPDFCREFTKGEVWFLMPRRPGKEDELIELKPGSPLPFVILGDAQGPVVPIFSSAARLAEGLKANRVPPRAYTAAATRPADHRRRSTRPSGANQPMSSDLTFITNEQGKCVASTA